MSDDERNGDARSIARVDMNAALVVSAISVAWTLTTSGLAIAIGIGSRTTSLIAFGLVGIVDAVGSAALIHHFRHGLRNDGLADDLERRAHRIVLVGLYLVGAAAVVGGVERWVSGTTNTGSDTGNAGSNAGVVLASVTFVALVGLSMRKQRIARRVSSDALLADGRLTAIGAAQAAITIGGTAVERWLGWHWADAVATIIIGCAAVTLSLTTAHRDRTIAANTS